jgi:DNA-binding helix-hairpin-helix protein with protein kinase domain
MIEILKPGQAVTTEAGEAVTVEQLLGSGGQGEVYRANWQGKPFALKWYYPQTATGGQLANLRELVKKGTPDARFLWPVDIVPPSCALPGYGYLMRLRGPEYKGIIDLMARRSEPTFRVLATAGFQLAECYLKLHSRGFCYCDISFGNIFWNDTTGDVLICDNDNVIVNGQQPEVAGTIGFMAPEVTTSSALPSIETDKHSLAVLLFYMFMLHHPLKGIKEESIRALDQPARVKIYGKEPLFIFHPTDQSNKPHPQHHQTVLNFWPIYPRFLKDLFIKAFTTGLADPHGRVTENEWRAAMVRLRDSIMYCTCSRAGTENFYDQEALKASGGAPSSCWQCKKQLTLPFRLRIGKTVVMLNHDTRLYPHHVEPNHEYDFAHPVAEISQNPRNPSQWGLKNLSTAKWTLARSDGTIADVEPGRSASLANGVRINFSAIEGEVRY